MAEKSLQRVEFGPPVEIRASADTRFNDADPKAFAALFKIRIENFMCVLLDALRSGAVTEDTYKDYIPLWKSISLRETDLQSHSTEYNNFFIDLLHSVIDEHRDALIAAGFEDPDRLRIGVPVMMSQVATRRSDIIEAVNAVVKPGYIDRYKLPVDPDAQRM